jgi:TNF(Tumour Necrosis Factor) family
VLYDDSRDLNGYVIEHNGLDHYQCTTMTHTGNTPSKTKVNSCYTSGLIHLRSGDKIRLRDLGNHRIVHMDKAKSYFGLIKINLVPAVSSAENTEIERFSSSSVVK